MSGVGLLRSGWGTGAQLRRSHLKLQASLPHSGLSGLSHFTSVQTSPSQVSLWLKPISHPDFAAEPDKGLVLTWSGFSQSFSHVLFPSRQEPLCLSSRDLRASTYFDPTVCQDLSLWFMFISSNF